MKRAFYKILWLMLLSELAGLGCGKFIRTNPGDNQKSNMVIPAKADNPPTPGPNPKADAPSEADIRNRFEVSLAPQSQEQTALTGDENDDYSQMVPEVKFKEETPAPQPAPAPQSAPAPAPAPAAPKPAAPAAGSPAATPPAPPASQPKTVPAAPVVVPVKPSATSSQPATGTPPPVEPPQQAPSQQPAVVGQKDQAIRFVDDGRLENPSSLLEARKKYSEIAPFEVLFPSRARHFGTTEMINTIEFLGQYLQSILPDARLLVSDISTQKGGPLFKIDPATHKFKVNETGQYIKSHASHQNGLDADIAYISTKKNQQRFFDVRSEIVAKNVDIKSQFEVFKQAIRSNQVELFFVYPEIKKELCLEALRQGAFKEGSEDQVALETLRRTVRDPGHYNHFHIRLRCNTESNPRCRNRNDMLPKWHECIFQKKDIK